MTTLLIAVAALLAGISLAESLSPDDIMKRAEEMQNWIIEQRRELHKTPEPGFAEHQTRRRIMRFLESHDIMYRCWQRAPCSEIYSTGAYYASLVGASELPKPTLVPLAVTRQSHTTMC